MERAHLDRIRAFFETQDGSDEAAHMVLVDRNLRYFGSVFGQEVEGLATYLGILRSARKDLGILCHRPRKVFGIWPEVAVLVDIHWKLPRTGFVESIWHLRFTAEERVDRITILWNPRGTVEL